MGINQVLGTNDACNQKSKKIFLCCLTYLLLLKLNFFFQNSYIRSKEFQLVFQLVNQLVIHWQRVKKKGQRKTKFKKLFFFKIMMAFSQYNCLPLS